MYQLRQSMKVPFFQFRKGRNKKAFNAGTPDGSPQYNGTICVTLTINNIRYGPYATDIYTFFHIWQGRNSTRPAEESRLLSQEIAEYALLLNRIYANLLHEAQMEANMTPIDGPMVMAATCMARKRVKEETRTKLRSLLGNQIIPVSLVDVYQEFLKTRRADIEPNRHKRGEGQISQTTYDTYAKRWAMIDAYLNHTNRKHIPIRSIKAAFGEQLRAYLKTRPQKNGQLYRIASINKALSLLKQLMSFAQLKGYINNNPVARLACRGNSPINPKPLTEEQMQYLEEVDLPKRLRHICDSWLVAAELCLHYSDFKRLPYITFYEVGGKRYIQHDRSKQQGDKLLQTVDVTPRAERILAKYNGTRRLYYGSSSDYSDALKVIAIRANLVDKDGELIRLQFGMGRDTGLTARGIRGANDMQLTRLGGWSSTRPARRYMGMDLEIVHGFASNSPTY